MARETAHMHFVDDGSRGWSVQRSVIFPIVGIRINHRAFHCEGRVVSRLLCGFAAIVFWNDYSPAIGIEENLRRVEPQTICRIKWTRDSVSIDLAWLYVGHKRVPVVIGTIREQVESNDARGSAVALRVEEQQIYS